MGMFGGPGPDGLTSFWSEGYQPLEPREQQRIDAALAGGEAIAQWVRGRVDGKRQLWLATERRLVMVGMSFFGRTRELPLGEVRALEYQEGAHGHTIRVTSERTRFGLVAVHPPMSQAFVDHLRQATGVEPVFIPSKRQPSAAERYAMEQAQREVARRAAQAETLAAQQAAGAEASAEPAPTGDLLARLREAAALREAGALNDEEFATLKRKLLG